MLTTSAKISIITINYNNKDGIERTTHSIISQSNNNFEWIVVDGGSLDGSKDIIIQNQRHLSYWVSEPDKGVYDAMNKGIEKATGEYCIFMNSGDCFFSSDVIENVLSSLDGTDFIYGNTHYTDGKIRLSKNEPGLFSFLYKSCYCHQSMFIKTELLKKHLYDITLKIVADWKFYLETMILGDASFKAIDLDVSLYDATGISSTNKELYERERDTILTSMFPKRMLEDYHDITFGRTVEDQLYIEIKHSVLHKLIYTLNVTIIRLLTFFSKGSTWAKKYPLRIK